MHRTVKPLSNPFPNKHLLAAAVLCTLALAGCHRSTTLDDAKTDTRVDAGRSKTAAAKPEVAAAADAVVAYEEVDKITVTGSRLAQPEARKASTRRDVADGYLYAPVAPPPPSPTPASSLKRAATASVRWSKAAPTGY